MVIFELIWMGAAPDLSEPQTFKIFSLQVIVYRTFTFCDKFYKKLYRTQHFDVQYTWPKWKWCPFTASSFHFHKNLPLRFRISDNTLECFWLTLSAKQFMCPADQACQDLQTEPKKVC